MIILFVFGGLLVIAIGLGMPVLVAGRFILGAGVVCALLTAINYVKDNRAHLAWREILQDLAGCALIAAAFLILLILL